MSVSIIFPVGDCISQTSGGLDNNPADVAAVQKLLASVGGKLGLSWLSTSAGPLPGPISFPSRNSALVEAIKRFQKEIMGLPHPDGRIDPGGATLRGLNALNESTDLKILDGVSVLLRAKVWSFIARFGPVAVSSGLRTPEKQAELMAPMSDQDLNMYNAQSPTVQKIKKLPRPRAVQKVAEIIREALKEGRRISDHLQGKAVDISARDSFDWDKAVAVAGKVGLRPKKEVSRNCFHVSL